uniref:MABP domain-containing protein n=1 Tax=Salvator merianae TaxID=96440 RepID=A0A8D0DZF2_SALMN
TEGGFAMTSAPLTGLGWTAAANAAPAGWTAIIYTMEGTPANCGKGFAQKSGYYLCYTSSISSENPTDVVNDVIILNDKTPLPSGYTYVKEFLDPKTSISKKKRLCVKLISAATADIAVFDILLSHKSKGVPNYMRIGEISGFALWCRKEHVQKPKPLPKPRKVSLGMKQLSLEQDKIDPSSEKPVAPLVPRRQATLKRHESIYESSNVYGISGTSPLLSCDDCFLFCFQYNYGFVVERTAAARLPPSIL